LLCAKGGTVLRFQELASHGVLKRSHVFAF